MDVLAVGDVHGCYHTFKALVEKHWDPSREFLVQVGDLINKGKNSGKAYLYAQELEREYPYQVFFLKGNHEHRFIQFHRRKGSDRAIEACKKDFLKRDIDLRKAAGWFSNRPLKWENPYVLITHAGISPFSKDPFGANARRGVLHNRGALKNVNKLQVHGHILQTKGEPTFNEVSNSWCIDTGAWTGQQLTAIRLSRKGKVRELLHEVTHPKDMS
ncbi:metallophosphoesterase [Phaeocystidibacter luteus]|uniref:Serine/threonine protein phosphatase n=1 Tax=Phaeocystidibacter luteus TaxID=911197 RepID=A0A6N6RJ53_9FLAO|nr:metallophosphoesterase [Phaeocystidibacter luteus]KAB2806770.1 serine/threonine protein phosphatase [Phaeocystidibacter luteus]